ncbi:hypothetical protein ACO0QE_000083 [Hanseniaspora vineae]
MFGINIGDSGSDKNKGVEDMSMNKTMENKSIESAESAESTESAENTESTESTENTEKKEVNNMTESWENIGSDMYMSYAGKEERTGRDASESDESSSSEYELDIELTKSNDLRRTRNTNTPQNNSNVNGILSSSSSSDNGSDEQQQHNEQRREVSENWHSLTQNLNDSASPTGKLVKERIITSQQSLKSASHGTALSFTSSSSSSSSGSGSGSNSEAALSSSLSSSPKEGSSPRLSPAQYLSRFVKKSRAKNENDASIHDKIVIPQRLSDVTDIQDFASFNEGNDNNNNNNTTTNNNNNNNNNNTGNPLDEFKNEFGEYGYDAYVDYDDDDEYYSSDQDSQDDDLTTTANDKEKTDERGKELYKLNRLKIDKHNQRTSSNSTMIVPTKSTSMTTSKSPHFHHHHHHQQHSHYIHEDMGSTISSLSSSSYIMPVIPFDSKYASGSTIIGGETNTTSASATATAVNPIHVSNVASSSIAGNFTNKPFIIPVYGPLKELFYLKAPEGYKKMLVVEEDITNVEIPIIIYSKNMEMEAEITKEDISNDKGTSKTKNKRGFLKKWYGKQFKVENKSNESETNNKQETIAKNSDSLDAQNINYLLAKFNELMLVPIIDSTSYSLEKSTTNQGKTQYEEYLKFLEPFYLNENLKILHQPVDITNNHEVFKLCRTLYKLKQEFQHQKVSTKQSEMEDADANVKEQEGLSPVFTEKDIPGVTSNTDKSKVIADTNTRHQLYKIKKMIYGYHNIGQPKPEDDNIDYEYFGPNDEEEEEHGLDRTTLWIISVGLGLGLSITLYYFNINPLKAVIDFFRPEDSYVASSTITYVPAPVSSFGCSGGGEGGGTSSAGLFAPKRHITNVYCYYVDNVPSIITVQLSKVSKWLQDTDASQTVQKISLATYSFVKSSGVVLVEYTDHALNSLSRYYAELFDWFRKLVAETSPDDLSLQSSTAFSSLTRTTTTLTRSIAAKSTSAAQLGCSHTTSALSTTTRNMDVSPLYAKLDDFTHWVPKVYGNVQSQVVQHAHILAQNPVIRDMSIIAKHLWAFFQTKLHDWAYQIQQQDCTSNKLLQTLSGTTKDVWGNVYDSYRNMNHVYHQHDQYSHIFQSIDA